MHERGEGRDHRALTAGEAQQQAGQGWYERPHEELVAAFRAYLDQEEAACREQGVTWSPLRDRIIEDRLAGESSYSDDPNARRRIEFFEPLYRAWQVLTYERKDRWDKHETAWHLCGWHEASRRRAEPRPDIIKLAEPLQVRILDALAEAVGIPHRRGQTDIEIPEHIRTYDRQLANQRRR
jgi:hypothetical protein